MADITKIAANLAPPSLSNALQHVSQLQAGQTIEAKITQIVNQELIRLTSSVGTFDLKAAHPALQPGVSVRVAVSDSGAVTLSLLPAKTAMPQGEVPPASVPNPARPAVITTLTGGQQPQVVPAPNIYSASGQTAQTSNTPAAQPTPVPLQAAPQRSQQIPIQTTITASPATPASAQASTTQASLQSVSPPAPVTPASVQPIAAALSQSLAQQQSFAPLIANLDLVSKSSKPLSEPVRTAVDQVLKAVSPVSEDMPPQKLQQAIKDAGTFFENKLAQIPAPDPQNPNPVLPLKLDFKGALLQLQSVLKEAVTHLPPVSLRPVSRENDPLPLPRNNEAPAPQAARAPALTANSVMGEILTTLSQETDSALSRLRVLQFASMPAYNDTPDQPVKPAQIWHVDLPVFMNGQAGVIPLQIERDAARRDAENAAHKWRVRFAFNLSDLGAVHAMLALGGGLVNVTLWAEKPDTYQLFKQMSRDLYSALIEEDLDVSDVELRNGSPRQAAQPAGSTLDTQT